MIGRGIGVRMGITTSVHCCAWNNWTGLRGKRQDRNRGNIQLTQKQLAFSGGFSGLPFLKA